MFNFLEIYRIFNKALGMLETRLHRKTCFSRPSLVHILTQYECNYNCEFCGFDYRTKPLKTQMSLDEYKIILKNLRPELLRDIVFSGMGEPLICKDFGEIVKYTRKHYPHIKLMINTNGELLTGETAKLVAENLDIVVISLHSLEAKTYSTISGNKSLQTVLDNIENLRELNPNLKFTFYFAYSMRNISEIKKHVDFCRQVNNSFFIGAYAKFYTRRRCFSDMNNENLFHVLDKDLSLFNHQEYSDEMVSEAAKHAKEIGLKKYIFPALFKNPFQKRANCTFPYSQIMIGPDGQVYPCGGSEVLMYEDIKEGKLNFGNLLENNIDEIWNTNDYPRLRTSSHGKSKCRSISYCKNCSTMGFMVNSGRVPESHFVDNRRKQNDE